MPETETFEGEPKGPSRSPCAVRILGQSQKKGNARPLMRSILMGYRAMMESLAGMTGLTAKIRG
jgi:hypothetical protein